MLKQLIDRASGGSSIAIKNMLSQSNKNVKNKSSSSCYSSFSSHHYSLRYLHFSQSRELTELIKQLPSPFMIMEDFNAHNPLWGSDKVTNKGKTVEDALSNHTLSTLTDGSNTYLHSSNGSYSSIDLTIVYPSLLIYLHWSIHDVLCGSYHFPVIF